MLYLLTGFYKDEGLEEDQFTIYGIFTTQEEAIRIKRGIDAANFLYNDPERLSITSLEPNKLTDDYYLRMEER